MRHGGCVARGSNGGPKSDKGKAITRRNSLRHGLWAKQLVIPQLESEGDWLALLNGLTEDYQPEGTAEVETVQEIAFQYWTRRRIRRAIDAEILKGVIDMPAGYEPSARLRGERIAGETAAEAAEFQREAERRLVPNERVMERVIRYQAHTTRQIEKLEAELRRRQEARRQEKPGTQWVEVRRAEE